MYSTQTIVADVDRIKQHWSSRKKTGVTELGKKLAITAFAFQLQEEKYFPLPFFSPFSWILQEFYKQEFCFSFENRANLVWLLAAD